MTMNTKGPGPQLDNNKELAERGREWGEITYARENTKKYIETDKPAPHGK